MSTQAPRNRRERPARGAPRGGRPGDKATWTPATKLGRLVAGGKINSLEEIFLHSLPIKEYQIVEKFLELEEEVLKVMSIQKQTKAGQRTSFKAFVIAGDRNGHVGLGVKTAKEASIAIKGAIIMAKLNIIPVRRGYWGGNLGLPHTVAGAVSGKCGSITVRLVPAPRGAGLIAAPRIKRVLEFAGLEDVYTQTVGHTRSVGNFVRATFFALQKTYAFLTPDLWEKTPVVVNPYEEHSGYLAQ